jgi:hypothetical protein
MRRELRHLNLILVRKQLHDCGHLGILVTTSDRRLRLR